VADLSKIYAANDYADLVAGNAADTDGSAARNLLFSTMGSVSRH